VSRYGEGVSLFKRVEGELHGEIKMLRQSEGGTLIGASILYMELFFWQVFGGEEFALFAAEKAC
jgi:hypothetical protein